MRLGERVFGGVGRFIGLHRQRAVDRILLEIYAAKRAWRPEASMRFAIGFFILVLTIASARAQECGRVGAETCMNGAMYRCMQAGGVKAWILRAPYEKCQAVRWEEQTPE